MCRGRGGGWGRARPWSSAGKATRGPGEGLKLMKTFINLVGGEGPTWEVQRTWASPMEA